jgi:hypothetical protein
MERISNSKAWEMIKNMAILKSQDEKLPCSCSTSVCRNQHEAGLFANDLTEITTDKKTVRRKDQPT